MAKRKDNKPAGVKTYTVCAPNRQFAGERGGLRFVKGTAQTQDPDLAAWFRSLGYTVSVDGQEMAAGRNAEAS